MGHLERARLARERGDEATKNRSEVDADLSLSGATLSAIPHPAAQQAGMAITNYGTQAHDALHQANPELAQKLDEGWLKAGKFSALVNPGPAIASSILKKLLSFGGRMGLGSNPNAKRTPDVIPNVNEKPFGSSSGAAPSHELHLLECAS